MSVSELVDSIGFGFAQLRALALAAGGVLFCSGLGVVIGNVMVLSVAADFGLSRNQRACLPTCTLTGLMVGTAVSGYFGDSLGRRHPVVWCFAGSAVFGFLCSAMPSFLGLLLCRGAHGVSMGFGAAPACAMLSEITPERWRITMRTMAQGMFPLGSLLAVGLAATSDASYEHLDWRRLFVMVSIPPAVLWFLALCFLPESPVFLACVGDDTRAAEGFKSMKRLSFSEAADLSYMPFGTSKSSALRLPLPTLWHQLGTVFAPQFRRATLGSMFACFCVNLVSYGDGYAAPMVLTKTSDLLPAYQYIAKFTIAVAWTAAIGFLAQVLSRKTMIVMGLAISSAVCFAFIFGASQPVPRHFLASVFFQIGANGIVVGVSMCFVVLYQLAVEIYPTTASSTGGAVVMGSGRLAAMCVPFLYENLKRLTGHWTAFYYVLGALAAVATVVVMCMQTAQAHRPGELDALDASGRSFGSVSAGKCALGPGV